MFPPETHRTAHHSDDTKAPRVEMLSSKVRLDVMNDQSFGSDEIRNPTRTSESKGFKIGTVRGLAADIHVLRLVAFGASIRGSGDIYIIYHMQCPPPSEHHQSMPPPPVGHFLSSPD
jgi:hypothetical protein